MHLMDAKPLWAALVATLMLTAIGTAAAEPFDKGYQAYRYADWSDHRPPHNDADEFKSALKAAVQGHSDAQFLVGELYSAGKGIPRNETEATKWYRKAAKQGHPQAQRYLGNRYYHASGVAKNYREALKWWRAAAEQGEAGAQYILGAQYALGTLVPKNYVEAYKWISLAASRFRPDGREERLAVGLRDGLASERMTSAQVSKGQRLAREWKRKPRE